MARPSMATRCSPGSVRCRRCSRKLMVRYTGMKHNIPRYSCHRGLLDNGEPRCIAFGGLRVDDAIEAAVLKVVEPGAIAAAIAAEAKLSQRRDQVREALGHDIEAARYAADRAFRQYDAADPANRFFVLLPVLRGIACRSRILFAPAIRANCSAMSSRRIEVSARAGEAR